MTLFMTCLAAFKIMLHRYTGHTDILVGTPVANRNRVELRPLVGLLVNTLLLRTDLQGNPTISELLKREREAALGAYANQDLPFEKLAAELRPQRKTNHAPFFQIMFAFATLSDAPLKLPGCSLEPIPIEKGTAAFDLSILFALSESGLTATWEYSTDLFEAMTIRRMTRHHLNILEAMTAATDQRLTELEILSSAERAEMVLTWNDTFVRYCGHECVHRLFEEVADSAPDTIAVLCEGQAVSYKELNARANQLAHYLKGLGIGPDRLVGICLERSIEMVVGLLGILKAGGAYLPLDPSYPKERLAFMIEDAQIDVLLSQERLAGHPPLAHGNVIYLDRDWPAISQHIAANPLSETGPLNLAYVIYTSGSTGRPKGPMNTHGGLRNRIRWMQERYQLGSEDCVLQKTPFSFDVSVWEFFWPLLAGARLVMARPGGHQDPGYVIDVMRKEKITTVHFVPSMLAVFLDEPGVEQCACLRRVICSGEALAKELQDKFFARLDFVELHNLYGPTEASIDVTHWACDRKSPLGTVPIGSPIANTQIHILDRELRPVPLGAAGELHIGGVGLARGYHGRTDLTAERFVPNPLSRQEGERLYRTGDLARYLPGGQIEYLGRIDHQVKLRGFRIEPEEIASVMKSYKSVKEAVVVVAVGNGQADKHLVGYVVPHENVSIVIDDLRRHLMARLPAYMVPLVIIPIERFPLTPNGKLDRNALPSPGKNRLHTTADFIAPRSSLEKDLAAMWRELLKIDKVGVTDSFFELGGHSLLMAQLVTRVRTAFHVEVPLRLFFDGPTIEQMTVTIAACQIEKEDPVEIARLLQEVQELAEEQVGRR